MVRKLRRLPSPALVVSCIALAISLGGVGYAAVVLPANSVGTKQLKDNAVVGSKVKVDSLRGPDILESSLGRVPSAADADLIDGLDSTTLQKRVTGNCEAGAVQSVNEDGSVGCLNLHLECPSGYAIYYGGQCWQNPDVSGYTFGGAASYCAGKDGRVPLYSELIAFGKANAAVVDIYLDWTANNTADDEALYINSGVETDDNRDGVRANTNASYVRCVTSPVVVGLQGP